MGGRLVICRGVLLLLLTGVYTDGRASDFVVRADGTGDLPTIQQAVDAAEDGDRILLHSGTFRGEGNRDIELNGKALFVGSAYPSPFPFVIDCEGTSSDPHRAFAVTGPGSVVIQGITIKNGFVEGSVEEQGGGVFCGPGSAPSFIDVQFWGNHAEAGGAVYSTGGSPQFNDCSFYLNTANLGAGIYLKDAVAPISISHSSFYHNESEQGSGILSDNAQLVISHSNFIANASTEGAVISLLSNSLLYCTHSIVYGSTDGAALGCDGGAAASITCSDVYGNAGGDWTDCIGGQSEVKGNISADPRFCNVVPADFWVGTHWSLQSNSPCRSGLSSLCEHIGIRDVGCGTTAVQALTWGSLKSRFR